MAQNNILICGVNWLGDSIMSMPALQVMTRENPCVSVTVLVKASQVALWELQPCVDRVLPLEPGLRGALRAACALRSQGFGSAYVFPNSFRSALVPFLASIPVRVGLKGHYRAWMLTRVVKLDKAVRRAHQSLEYAAMLDLTLPEGARFAPFTEPLLSVQPGWADAILSAASLDPTRPMIAALPGAARGPSKRWPAEHFVAVAKRLVETCGCTVVVCGVEAEAALCEEVAGGIGEAAVNLAGRTGIRELSALLSRCKTVLCNDSGGMHLATAVGTRVVAVYGMTDPGKTGPMGDASRIIQREGIEASRDIARHSTEAEAALQGISPDEVYAAAAPMLTESSDPQP